MSDRKLFQTVWILFVLMFTVCVASLCRRVKALDTVEEKKKCTEAMFKIVENSYTEPHVQITDTLIIPNSYTIDFSKAMKFRTPAARNFYISNEGQLHNMLNNVGCYIKTVSSNKETSMDFSIFKVNGGFVTLCSENTTQYVEEGYVFLLDYDDEHDGSVTLTIDSDDYRQTYELKASEHTVILDTTRFFRYDFYISEHATMGWELQSITGGLDCEPMDLMRFLHSDDKPFSLPDDDIPPINVEFCTKPGTLFHLVGFVPQFNQGGM